MSQNSKSILSEIVMKNGLPTPVYTSSKSGPDHVPRFASTVRLGSICVTGSNKRTKIEAEQAAAELCIAQLRPFSVHAIDVHPIPFCASEKCSDLDVSKLNLSRETAKVDSADQEAFNDEAKTFLVLAEAASREITYVNQISILNSRFRTISDLLNILEFACRCPSPVVKDTLREMRAQMDQQTIGNLGSGNSKGDGVDRSASRFLIEPTLDPDFTWDCDLEPSVFKMEHEWKFQDVHISGLGYSSYLDNHPFMMRPPLKSSHQPLILDVTPEEMERVWDEINHPLNSSPDEPLQTQESIGLLGGGASKGDGPWPTIFLLIWCMMVVTKKQEKKIEKKVEKALEQRPNGGKAKRLLTYEAQMRANKQRARIQPQQARMVNPFLRKPQRALFSPGPNIPNKDFRRGIISGAVGRALPTNKLGAFLGVTPEEEVLLAFVMPEQFPPVRYSDQFTAVKTALAHPRLQVKTDWNTGAAYTNSTVGLTETFAVATRQAERAFIYLDHNGSAQPMAYQIYGSDVSVGTPVIPTSAWLVSQPQVGTYQGLHWVYAASVGYSPHGPYMMAAACGAGGPDDLRFFWMDQGDQLAINYSTVATQIPIFRVDYWQPSGFKQGWAVFTGTTGTSQSVTLKPVNSSFPAGYYSVSMSASVVPGSININSMQITATASVAHTCHLMARDYFQNISRAKDYRLMAASIMWSNTTAINYIGGDIVQYQMPRGTHWMDLFVNSPFSALGAFQDVVRRNALNGCYSFMKPADQMDMTLQNYSTIEQGILVDSYYPLDSENSFLAVAIKVPQPTTTAVQAGTWTFANGIEYMTQDTWTLTKEPTLPSLLYTKVLDQLKQLNQHYENASHFSSILSRIGAFGKRVIDGVNKYGPDVVGILSKLAEMTVDLPF